MKIFTFTVLLTAFSCALAPAQNCTRDSLKAIIGSYFSAVEAHNSTLLRTAPNVRFTENGKEVQLGDGFFQSGGKLLFQRNLIDTERCGTLTEAVVDETVNGTTAPVLMAVRLRVDSGKLSEIETIITRKGELFFKPEGVIDTKDQDWESILPPDQRSTREHMNDAANKYFDMFVQAPTVNAPFATPCNRWEGGFQTTAKTGNCSPKGLVLTHTHRRFPVTDVEAGITAAFVNFNKSLPDVHMFKFKDGKIVWIQAVFGGRTEAAPWPDEPK